MMNVYQQVEKLLQEQDDRPAWADEILFELKEIKDMLSKIDKTSNQNRSKNSGYFSFVKKLRNELRADIQNGIYPEIDYFHKKLGINFKGHIYNKETNEVLKKEDAFKVYEFLYKNRKKLDKFIKK
jgi:uncharacterized coiled-coil DUF342 family protein